MKKGIDISYANGKVDWKKIKADETEFAFIRIGYGKEASSQKDAQFEANYSGAKMVGVPIGGYHFSYTTTVDGAKQEANACLKMLNGKKFELPIAYDLETAQQYSLSPTTLYNIYKTFAKIMEANGYRVMLYTNLAWMKNKWDKTNIVADGVKIWMAQYNSTMTYSNQSAISIWQYSSKGSVSGISGNVDMNIAYVDLLETNKPVQERKTEWINENEKWWYCHADGSYTKNDWELIEENWYHFDENGWMQTGWLEVDGEWYYLNPISDGTKGSMKTGWIKDNDNWYYCNSKGTMITGWHILDWEGRKSWYYFEPVSGKNKGHMYRNTWLYYKNSYYYFYADGTMATNKKIIWNGKEFRLDENGKCLSPTPIFMN